MLIDVTELLKILDAIEAEIHEADLYKMILAGTLSCPAFKGIDKNYKIHPLVDTKIISNAVNFIKYLHVYDETSSCETIYNNIFTDQNCQGYDVLTHALTQDRKCFICRMLDGSIHAIPYSLAHDRSDIIAVLAFPTVKSLCLRCESSHEWIESGGCLENCDNLVYVAPLPEGIEDIAGLFVGCKKLNCPIYLPNSIQWALDLLEGCDQFSSAIYIRGPVHRDLGLGEFTKYLQIL